MNNKEIISVKDLSLFYNKKTLLDKVNMSIKKRNIVALIGPSGSGKSSLLRCFNRMHDLQENIKITGKIFLQNSDIYAPSMSPYLLRAKVGMVFQKPNPFHKSIYENVAYALKIHNIIHKKSKIDDLVEKMLKKVQLWAEVKDNLHKDATLLSGGQQQKLCIARALMAKPSVILMDEPCSALDPISSHLIDDLIMELKEKFTIVIVTHSIEQAEKLADYLYFMCNGNIIEHGPKEQILDHPKSEEIKKYLYHYRKKNKIS